MFLIGMQHTCLQVFTWINYNHKMKQTEFVESQVF